MSLPAANYSSWQNNFLKAFNESKVKDGHFLSKIRNCHPETAKECITENLEDFSVEKKRVVALIDERILSSGINENEEMKENLLIIKATITSENLEQSAEKNKHERNDKSTKKKPATKALKELWEATQSFPEGDKASWQEFLLECEKTLQCLSYALRIKNCTRKREGEFERHPYLSDLYALCNATDLSPNDILFNSISNRLHYFNDFRNIWSYINETSVGERFLQVFEIDPYEPLAFNCNIPIDKRFRLFFVAELISCFEPTNSVFSAIKIDGDQRLTYDLHPDKSTLSLIVKMVNTFKNEKNPSTLEHLLIHKDLFVYDHIFLDNPSFDWEFSITTRTFLYFEDELTENQNWNEHNHFMITLHFQLFYISINVLLKLHKSYHSDVKQDVFISDYLENNPDMLRFLKELFQLSFAYINQYSFIDCCGMCYKEDDGTDGHPAKNNGRMLENPKTGDVDKKIHGASKATYRNSEAYER